MFQIICFYILFVSFLFKKSKLNRLNYFLETIGEEKVSGVSGYKILN